MHLTYENTNEEIIAVKRKPRHQPPHLHNAMEIVCVTKGTLELGVGQELYHMETGDIGVVFPDVIHHYQVFSSEVNEAVFINAPQMIFGRFENVLRNKAPQYPVVKSDVIPDEVYRAVESIIDTKQNDEVERDGGQLCQRLLASGNLRETGRVAQGERSVFIEYLFVDAAVIFQHESIVRIGYQKDVENAPCHEVGKLCVLEIELV